MIDRDYFTTTNVFVFLMGLTLLATSAFAVYSFLGTVVFGVFFYYASRPLYESINKYTEKETLSASISIIVFVLPLVVLISYTVLIAWNEFILFTQTHSISGVNDTISQYVNLQKMSSNPVKMVRNSTDVRSLVLSLLSYFSVFATVLINAFLVVTITFFALRDGRKFRRIIESILPDEPVVKNFIESIDKDFEILFFGNILHALLSSVIGAIGFVVLAELSPQGVTIPYPFLLGVLVGVASLIPIVGMKIIYVPVVGIVAVNSYAAGPDTYFFPVVVLVVSVVVIDTIPDFLIRPYVSGENIHMGLLMIAYIVGPLIFGWYGLFFGPLLLVLITNFYTETVSSDTETEYTQGDIVLVSDETSQWIGTVIDSDEKVTTRPIEYVTGESTGNEIDTDTRQVVKNDILRKMDVDENEDQSATYS